jgi:hypothetical protein
MGFARPLARRWTLHLRPRTSESGAPVCHPALVLGCASLRFPGHHRPRRCRLFHLLDPAFIYQVLQAGCVIDYNLRRRVKRALATLFFIDQWRFHQRFRSTIESHFAWAKRYFGLESARWCGKVVAYHHTT